MSTNALVTGVAQEQHHLALSHHTGARRPRAPSSGGAVHTCCWGPACGARGCVRPHQQRRSPQPPSAATRRTTLALTVALPAAATAGSSVQAAGLPPGPALAPQPDRTCTAQFHYRDVLQQGYAGPGPLTARSLPRLEHTCTSCFPACVGDKCIVGIDVTYPRGGRALNLAPPFPLVVWVGGFTVGSAAYASTAGRLASWGYTVLRYDTREALTELLDDLTQVALLKEVLDWAAAHPLVRQLADVRSGVMLAGHSRGAKLATLAAAQDSRVAGLALVDPVDVTVYRPESPRDPSATAALAAAVRGTSLVDTASDTAPVGAQGGEAAAAAAAAVAAAVVPQRRPRFLPVAIIGGTLGGACAPQESNYAAYFNAAACAIEVEVQGAGHFAVLDDDGAALQRAMCARSEPTVADSAVRALAQGVVIALCEAVMRPGGSGVMAALARRCGADGQQQQQQQQQQQATAALALAAASQAQAAPRAAMGPPTWASQRTPPPVYLPPGPLPPPTLQREDAGPELRARLERAIGQLRYNCSVQQGALLQVGVRFKGFDGGG